LRGQGVIDKKKEMRLHEMYDVVDKMKRAVWDYANQVREEW
jgi:hypothetical protein